MKYLLEPLRAEKSEADAGLLQRHLFCIGLLCGFGRIFIANIGIEMCIRDRSLGPKLAAKPAAGSSCMLEEHSHYTTYPDRVQVLEYCYLAAPNHDLLLEILENCLGLLRFQAGIRPTC